MTSVASAARQSIPADSQSASSCVCSASAGQDTPPDTTSQDSLRWTVYLLRERKDKLVGIAAAFLLIVVWAILVFHNLLIALVGCLVAAGAVKEYIAPLQFSLDAERVTVRCAGITWIEMPWEQIRSVYRTPAGLKLSPYADPKKHRFEEIRGVTLRFPRAMCSLVERFVDERIAAAAVSGAAK